MDIIICHGTMGSPEGKWFPWLSDQCKDMGHNVYVPRFPTPENQSKDNWCTILQDQAPIFGKNTILIGHSISATFLLHILEATQNPVLQSIFVSPVMDDIGNVEYDQLNKTFVHHEFDWSKINTNKGQSNILHGNDDPYVPLSHAKLLGLKIETPVTVIENGGHLNTESGYTTFPKIFDLIKS